MRISLLQTLRVFVLKTIEESVKAAHDFESSIVVGWLWFFGGVIPLFDNKVGLDLSTHDKVSDIQSRHEAKFNVSVGVKECGDAS